MMDTPELSPTVDLELHGSNRQLESFLSGALYCRAVVLSNLLASYTLTLSVSRPSSLTPNLQAAGILHTLTL